MRRTNQHVKHVTLKSYIATQLNGSNWSAKKAILELIDNSMDAGATNVVISKNKKDLTITDNGCGTPVPYCIIDPHNRQDTHGGKGTGQFGIGGAFAAIYLTECGYVEATSVHEGVERGVYADWATIGDSPDYPTEELFPERPTDSASGTTVKMKVTGYKFGPQVKDALMNDLGVLYKPGLMNGVNITIDGQTVHPPFTPEMVETPRECEVVLSCGMKFTAKMGLLKPGVNASCNRVYYGPRLMDNGHDFLSTSKTNTSRIMFEMFLQPDECRRHGLRVTTTKESFLSNDETTSDLLAEMTAAVAETFKTTLTAAAEQVQVFRLNFMTTAINKAVKAGISAAVNPRPYMRSGESTGATRDESGRGRDDDFVDSREFGCEDATSGEFSIEFIVEPTYGDAGAIAIKLAGDAITVRVNRDKLMGRNADEEVSWMLDSMPGLIRSKIYDWGDNRKNKLSALVAHNPDWAYLLDTEKRGGHGTTPRLIELFNNIRIEALAMLSGKRAEVVK